MASPIAERPTDQRGIHTVYIWAIASIAALGGLLFGYDWVVIGGAKPFYEAHFHLQSDRLIGWANSCALLGCLVGSFLAGAMNRKYGRKQILLASGMLFAVSSVFTGWAPGFDTFIAWRIMGGVAIGLASNISPTYIAEIAPANWRGRLVSLNQLAIVCGIMAAQIVNWGIAEKVPEHATMTFIAASWNGNYGWRWMFTAVSLPAMIFVVCLILIPESPRWLASKARTEEAFQVLARIGGENYARRALGKIDESLESESKRSASWKDLLAPRLRYVLLIGVGLAILQQWSGINILFNYAEEVYKSAGYGISAVLVQHHYHRRGESFVYAAVDDAGRSIWAKSAASGWMWRDWNCGPVGCVRLSRTSSRRVCADANSFRHRLLCSLARSRYLGCNFGDLSQSLA